MSVLSDLPFPSHSSSVLDTLSPVTFDEVGRILSRSPAKSSNMDIIPASLVLRCKSVFCEIITYFANLSFSEGIFPALFKKATVTPLIKGHSLDKSEPFNYRPISNLNFISKVLERLFLCRFQSHILKYPNFNSHQSAYRPHCSTETALQLLLDQVYSAADEGKPTLLISLDLSAAFDTVDHSVLLKRLSCSFGITGNVLSWIQSYLCDRTQSVRIGSHSSPPNPCLVGVPQGSVLGQLLFSIYTSPISTIAESHHVSQQQYADDTQLYVPVALLPANYNKDITALENLLFRSMSSFLGVRRTAVQMPMLKGSRGGFFGFRSTRCG